MLDRRAFERLIDAIGCTPGELFSVNESPFFEPIQTYGKFQGAPRCFVLTPRHNPGEQPRDHEAIDLLEDFTKDNVPGVSVFTSPASDDSTLESSLSEGSCIIIGGPRANRLAELALCAPFGITPFAELANQSPFLFLDARSGQGRSSLILQEPLPGFASQHGIVIPAEQQLVPSAIWESEVLRELDLRNETEAGLVFVHNLELSTGQKRKVIVIAGVSRIGTLAAAHAIVGDYRDLEPIDQEQVVWGIVQGFYNKPIGTGRRRYRDFRWVMRKGGRKPLRFSLKKGARIAVGDATPSIEAAKG